MRLLVALFPAARALAVALPLLAAGGARAESAAVAALREAVDLAERGAWDAARAEAEAGGAVVEAIIEWRRLRDDGDGEFLDYAAFLDAHPHWPDLDEVRANGETAIPQNTAAASVVSFFGTDFMGDALPQTGMGARELARALQAQGRGAEAEAMLVEVWLTRPLNDAGQAALVDAFPEVLAPHHWARAEGLLWRWRASDAERMLHLLPDERRALARARMEAIRGGSPDLDALPASLRDDPGLAFDRFNHLAEEGEYDEALAVLRPRTGSAEGLGEPARWGAWRAQIVRWLAREGRVAEAYEVAASHHMTEGDAYADLEWLAGWTSLRFLDEPERALRHFQASEAAVDGPISLSRAAYWTGRAEEALGRPDDAALSFARGARHQTAFYGLLAAERLGLTLDPALTGAEDFGDWRASPEMAGDLNQAMLLLLAAGERQDALRFALQMARTFERPALGQLAMLLEQMHEPYMAVLVGKAAAGRGVIVPAAYFPLHPMARQDWPVGADLALSIARRESEFNARVSSPVGAQGLMQLMPATAREVAGWLDLPYSADRLGDWEYNAALGTRYLQMLEEQFGSSPVLIAAGYNAGPGRPRQWMAARGDIRDAQVDVVDWIEMIPFAETRTYVMRVSESIPVYRARLTGATGPVAFTALLRGEPPHIRPTLRPRIVDASSLVPVQRVSTSDAPPLLAEPPPGRPVARPAVE